MDPIGHVLVVSKMDHLTAISEITGGAHKTAGSIPLHKTTVSAEVQQTFATVLAKDTDESAQKSPQELKQEKAVSELAKIITSQVVGTIFDEQQSLFASEDQATKHYHQMMVDAISDQLTATDALGLGAIIKAEIGD